MLIEDRFFDQGWVQELSNEDFRMLLYLMHFASKKCGIVELNMRMLNFAANTGRMYTQEEVLERFSGMVRLIPGKRSTAIFPNWIATNWAKNGKPIDTERNPLFKSIVQELASYGLTIEKVNAMAKAKVSVKDADNDSSGAGAALPSVRQTLQGTVLKLPEDDGAETPESMFERFWKSYPGPRKVDKKKCLAKFVAAIRRGDRFDDIMSGLSAWKRCSTWNKDNGEFIRAPLVWLNNENWKDTPDDQCGGAVVNEEVRREARKRKVAEAVASLKPEDWELCRESGCSLFAEGRCSRYRLPCSHPLQPRPCAPEECPSYSTTTK